MKLAVLTAALVAAIPAMAAPAGSIEARAEFAAPVTLAFTSQAQGVFTDATRRGTKLDPVASVDASNPGEKQRYTFTDSSDVAKIAWVVGGEKLDCNIEFKADPGVTFISLDLEKDLYTKGLKQNVCGYSLQTNCFKF